MFFLNWRVFNQFLFVFLSKEDQRHRNRDESEMTQWTVTC